MAVTVGQNGVFLRNSELVLFQYLETRIVFRDPTPPLFKAPSVFLFASVLRSSVQVLSVALAIQFNVILF